MSFRDALCEALREALRADEKVFLLGEDIAALGGAFSVTKGLWEEFGDKRVRNTPLSEVAIVGAAIGAAAAGLRPVAEIMFCDFLPVAMDQIVNQAAKMKYMFGGKLKLPMVVRSTIGAGLSAAAQHSQSLEALFMHIPGLKVVIPSTPYDAKGLLTQAIQDDNPVFFFEHKGLYDVKGPVPEEPYAIPFGQADVKRPGRHVTIVATAQMVHKSLAAAQHLSARGIEAEVIDPRTLVPLDMETIVRSVEKTGRAVVVHEACRTAGAGAEIAARLAEEAFDSLDAPIKRVAGKDVPIPFNPQLERFVIPQEQDIISAVLEVTGRG